MVRRLAVPLLLLAIAIAAGVGALAADAGGETAEAAVEIRAPVTPVLSARRVPDHVTQTLADDRLTASLVALVDRAPADTCLLVDAAGRPIIDHRSGSALVPASNEKLLVAAAALDVLGPEHRFRTSVLSARPPAGGVVRGDLFLVGGGDPLLTTRRYAGTSPKQGEAHSSLEDLADRVRAAGVRVVRGDVVGDDSRFDHERYVDAWPSRFIDQHQTGPLSALSVNDGFQSFPTRGDPGAPEQASADPPRLAAQTFIELLRRRGIQVTGAAVTGTAPGANHRIAQLRSAPLRDITAQLLTWSDNQTAELLLKDLGVEHAQQGTTAAGADAVEAILGGAGIDLTGVDAVDGSGLASSNLVTCRALHQVLADAGPDSDLVDGLAVAGRTGTLAATFNDTPAEGRLRAKTGSLNEARALSGVVLVPQGDDLTFALLVNEPPYISPEGDQVRVDVGLALAAYPDRPPLREVGPEPLRGG